MKGLFVALLLVLLQARIGVCQFNDSINYYANLSSTGILNKTNNGNSYVLNNSFRFNIYKKSVAINTINSWMFGKNQERLTNNDYTAGLDVNLFKNERHVYYWALANYEKSYSLKINYRLQSGGGVGYYILDKADFVVQISDGILYETSDLYDAENTANEFEILRNSFRLKFRVTGWNVLTLEGSDFIQHALSDKHDYIIRSNTNLSVKLRKWLSITLAVNYNKLSVTGRDNFLLNYGLTIEKYF